MPDLPDGVQRDDAFVRLATIEVGVAGSGSNLLVADTGVRGHLLKPDQQLSQTIVQRTRIECGGDGRLPVGGRRS